MVWKIIIQIQAKLIQAKLEFEGRRMKNPTRSTPQILSVRPDLVRSPRQDGWTDLTKIWWQCSGRVAIGFARKKKKKMILKICKFLFSGFFISEHLFF
jgi:hypothetical protein